MKIIDILNKMTNETLEDVLKFKYDDCIWECKYKNKSITNDYGVSLFGEYCIERILTDEVEVIEDIKELEEIKMPNLQVNINSIELVFENCESVSLNPSEFKYLSIDGIDKSKHINCFQYKNGEEIINNNCDYFHILINKESLKKMIGFNDRISLKERLGYYDITQVILNYGGREEIIFVPWSEISEFSNDEYEKHETLDNGDMEITIERK